MTYSIVARDPATGQMGVATQTQALAVGASVPWASPGYGVIATQSMGEPMYGQLGLDMLRGGLTAPEVLAALREVDPHPERRQVAMVDTRGGIDVYTGSACVAAAGHRIADDCAALANLVAGPEVWDAMVDTYTSRAGTLASRLLAALHAAEDAGGDIRGRRSASLVVVCAERTGRPWRDHLVDLRVDAAADPLGDLDRMLERSERYHRVVAALDDALDGRAAEAAADLDEVTGDGPGSDPDLTMWRALVLGLAGREDEARDLVEALDASAPAFVESLRRFGPAGLVPDPDLLHRLLPEGQPAS